MLATKRQNIRKEKEQKEQEEKIIYKIGKHRNQKHDQDLAVQKERTKRLQ